MSGERGTIQKAEPEVEKPVAGTMGQAMRDILKRQKNHSTYAKALNAESRDVHKRLNFYSVYAKKSLKRELSRIRRHKRKGRVSEEEADQRIAETLDTYNQISSSPEAVLDFLYSQEDKLSVSVRGVGTKATVSKKLSEVRADIKELELFLEAREVHAKLSETYAYMPVVFDSKITFLEEQIRGRRLGPLDYEKAVKSLSSTVHEFDRYLNSSSRMIDAIKSEIGSLKEELSGEGVSSARERRIKANITKLELDLHAAAQQKKLYASEAPAFFNVNGPLKFDVGEYTVTTSCDAKRIESIASPEGSRIFFGHSNTIVISADGESAVYDLEDNLLQTVSSDGTTIQFSNGEVVRIRDQEGNWYFCDPALSEVSGAVIINGQGKKVTNKKDFKRLSSHFEEIRGKAISRQAFFFSLKERLEPLKGQGEFTSAHNYELAKAAASLEEKPLAPAEQMKENVKILSNSSLFSFDAVGPKLYGSNKRAARAEAHLKRLKGRVNFLSPELALQVSGFLRLEHPANISTDFSNTVLVEVPMPPRKIRPGEGLNLLSEIHTVSVKGKRISIVTVPGPVLHAIMSGDFGVLGKFAYDDITADVRSKYNWVGWVSRLPNSDASKYIRMHYGDDVYSAFRAVYTSRSKSDIQAAYQQLGRYFVSDLLSYSFVQAHHRPFIRKLRDEELDSLKQEISEELVQKEIKGDPEEMAFTYLKTIFEGRTKEEIRDDIYLLYASALSVDPSISGEELMRREDDAFTVFCNSPSEATFNEWFKYAKYMEVLANPFKFIPREVSRELMRKSWDEHPHFHSLRKAPKEYLEVCKSMYEKQLERRVLIERCRIVEEAIATVVQPFSQADKYSSRMANSIALYVQYKAEINPYSRASAEKARVSKEFVSAEALFNAIKHSTSPWELLSKVERVIVLNNAQYNYEFMSRLGQAKNKEKRDQDIARVLELTKTALEFGTEVIKTINPGG